MAMLSDQVIGNLLQALFRIKHFSFVNVFYLNINNRIAFLFVFTNVFNTKSQNILITNGIRNNILVQTFSKQIFCGALPQLIFVRIINENRCTRKTEELTFLKIFNYPVMRFAK